MRTCVLQLPQKQTGGANGMMWVTTSAPLKESEMLAGFDNKSQLKEPVSVKSTCTTSCWASACGSGSRNTRRPYCHANVDEQAKSAVNVSFSCIAHIEQLWSVELS